MLKQLFTALLCGFAIVAPVRAQEAVAGRISTANGGIPTLEQMRMAGALAAEQQRKQTLLERTNPTGGSSLGGPKPVSLAERRNSETRVARANAQRALATRPTNSEALSPGLLRPTMVENETQRPLSYYSYKTPEGKRESAPVTTQYYPKRIVRPFATIDRHIDPKLMQAATIAQERAHAHSRSMCWHYVKEALVASGVVDSFPKSELAKDAAQDLVSNYGFKKLPVKDPFAAPIGAVLVYGAQHTAGHVEIRTKDGFVSDFCSKTPSPRPLLGVYAKL